MWATHSKNGTELTSDVEIICRENGCSDGHTVEDHVRCLKSVHWTKLTINNVCKVSNVIQSELVNIELRHLDVLHFIIEECHHLANGYTAKLDCIDLVMFCYYVICLRAIICDKIQ